MKFPLGHLVMTRGVADLDDPDRLMACLKRHASGDWGDICEEDRALNNEALRLGNRVLSAYKQDNAETIWIITEADRSSTTFLLPDEY